MSSNFEWRTDEDANWNIREEKRPSRPPRRPIWTALLLIALLIGGGYALYSQLSQRIELATSDVEADILASHNLIQQAAAAGDVDVFRTLLSGADIGWTSAQSVLVDEAIFFDRSAFGLTPLTAGKPVAASDVALTLAPDLMAAELTTVQPYALANGSGVTETINLQQTAVYRLGNNRWLYAPPAREFWGNWLTTEGKYLTMVYPQRDEEVALSLSFDLEALLFEVCSLPGLTCGDDFHMRLRLDTSPSSLQTAVNLGHLLSSTPRLELPAPTLIGSPIDDMGYQALYRGYGALLVTGALAELTEYECCRQGQLFRALVDYQLDELGLRPYPFAAADYDGLLLQSFEPQRFASVWALRLQDDDQRAAAYSLVAFLHSQPQAPATSEMLARLAASSVSESWFNAVTAVTPFNRDQFGNDWLAFTIAQGTSAQQPPPHSVPAQPLQLICFAEGGSHAYQYQYDFAADTWQQQPRLMTADGVAEVPLGQATFRATGNIPQVDKLTLTSERGEVTLWQRGDDGGPLWLMAEMGPDNRYVLLGDYGSMDSAGRVANLLLVDTATCAPGDCPLTPVPAFVLPAWSPDGSRALFGYAEREAAGIVVGLGDWQLTLVLAAARLDGSQTLRAVGRSLFWLDDARFGYVALTDGDALEPQTAVRLTTVSSPETAVDLLTAEQLRQALPAAQRPASLLIRDVVVQPAGDLLVVTAVPTPAAQSSFTFLVTLPPADQPAADIRWLNQFVAGASVAFSPNGRWVYSTYLGQFTLYDTVTGAVQTRSSGGSVFGSLIIWSPDGNWLAELREDYLLLQSPTTGYVRVAPHDFDTCYRLDW